ncbi:chaperone protein hscB [Buchnera aphidicola str. APS (Acyrthosiphon pisum)]|uniref:Co-chaperone protein HscB n=1 Tax=Buchnera aphidicola subsp. Acyrthosiphon pisum (strain APS) TaxID=107806 RepID=HSCB_BUCAI|nr:Fe-S protein assembly co-chaperone HscB [Buchnera aphidicola]P57659.1 RecName: Full=Co-chaperone protein HscB; AltName: Full=Hsc20 [Buchnera aphidicola str. APS (Acyrthosiphon pisum)]pir/H84999/ chaperone protein hscB [imported] - Buchnera sp. (strain APS) [Buchnera sp. (in: enterobacteria)]BAB13288.1 chaperone protein hscB [Buchnera aphidicola str. APS (Acyrthosiphon pisum)]
MNYFTLFDLPRKFNIDKKLLSQNFYKLQLKFHPDLFINDSESKKKIILEKSIQINKGYKTLKNFLNRAIYFLCLNGYEVKKETLLLKNNDFLIRYFSLYEQLDNLKENNFNKKELNNLEQIIQKKIIYCKKKIELEFEKTRYKKVIKIISELLFFEKIKDVLKKEYNIYLSQIN